MLLGISESIARIYRAFILFGRCSVQLSEKFVQACSICTRLLLLRHKYARTLRKPRRSGFAKVGLSKRRAKKGMLFATRGYTNGKSKLFLIQSSVLGIFSDGPSRKCNSRHYIAASATSKNKKRSFRNTGAY